MAGLTSNSNLANAQAKPNPLDDFQSFNNLFTLASLSSSQLNGGNISKSSIQNIICRSQGIGSGGVQTDFGSFDYFIDDVTIVTIPAASAKTGNSFATKLTFKVHEPYSMGLFMLALRQAANKAGYQQNFNEAPFVFMIEWVGYVNNRPASTTDNLTRIIPIKLISVKFRVGLTGSVYECEAIPYNELAFREQTVRNVTDIQISGKTVKDILATGPTSLITQMLTRQKNDQNIENPDIISIEFPKDYMQASGQIDPQQSPIAQAVVYSDNSNAGSQPFPDLTKVFLDGKQVIKSSAYKIDPDRAWHFTQEISIPDIIVEVIMRSDYIVKQLVGNRIQADENDQANWFRIETQVKDMSANQKLGRQQRQIIFRVIPYKVAIHRFLPPNTRPPKQYQNLKTQPTRVYDYIYTGNNTEVLDLELNFDMAFFTPVPSDHVSNVGQSNPGQGSILAGGKPSTYTWPDAGIYYQFGGLTQQFGQGLPGSLTVPSLPGLTTAGADRGAAFQQFMQSQQAQNSSSQEVGQGELVPSSVPTAQRQFFYKAPGGAGTDKPETSQVRVMNALLTNPGDMVNLTMTIMGDPYYIPSSGMGNQAVKSSGPSILDDGSMNYQAGEVYIIINFRTPIDFNPITGLYDFQSKIDMWSGLYQVIQVESKFNGNKFTQVLSGIRLRAQLGGQPASSIFLQQGQEGGQGGGGPAQNGGSPATPTTPGQ